jgi:hypothetical protein
MWSTGHRPRSNPAAPRPVPPCGTALREDALREVTMRPDPVDLALAMSADLDEDTLRGYFASRRQALSGRAADFARVRAHSWPDQGPADDLIIEHAMARIETELRWHDMVLDRIGKLTGHKGVARAAADGTPAASATADALVRAGTALAGPVRAGGRRGTDRRP